VNQAGPATKDPECFLQTKALQQQSITSVSTPTDPDLLNGHAYFGVLVDMAICFFAGVGFQYPSGKFIRDSLTKAVFILPVEGEISRVATSHTPLDPGLSCKNAHGVWNLDQETCNGSVVGIMWAKLIELLISHGLLFVMVIAWLFKLSPTNGTKVDSYLVLRNWSFRLTN